MAAADEKLLIPEGRTREVLRWLRRIPERVAHPARRAAAVKLVAGLRPPLNVLVLCYGNICRSPYAAAALREAARRDPTLRMQVESAGFVGPDRPAPAEGQAVASRRGISLAEHRSRLLTPELVRGASLIVVMDVGQRERVARQFGRRARVVLLGDFDPQPIRRRTIHDPYSQAEPVFEQVYERVDRCLETLLAALPRLPAEASASPAANAQSTPASHG